MHPLLTFGRLVVKAARFFCLNCVWYVGITTMGATVSTVRNWERRL